MPTQTRTIRLRPEAFTAEAIAAYGWRSLSGGAVSMGVSPSTLRRAVAGHTVPGERLIAALLAHTGRSFDDLFTTTDP